MEYIEALGLPTWIRWAGVTYAYSIVGVYTLIVYWPLSVIVARAVRKNQDSHWTELARHLHLARAAIIIVGVFLPLVIIFELQEDSPPTILVDMSRFSFIFWGGFISYGVVFVVWLLYRRRLSLDSSPLGYRLKGLLTSFALIYKHYIIIFLLLVAFPDEAGTTAVIMTLVAAALMIVLTFTNEVKILCLFGLARPAGLRLTRVVKDTSEEMGHEPPFVFEVMSPSPNAFAIPLKNAVAFTDSIIDLLEDEELKAICAHEIAHLEEPLKILAFRVAIPFLMLPIPWAKVMGPLGFAIPLALLALNMLVFKFSRSMESKADARALELSDMDAHFARALEKMHAKRLLPAVMDGKGTTHPHPYDRMIEAGVEPDYPRPDPPPTAKYLAILLALFLVHPVFVVVKSTTSDRIVNLGGYPEETRLILTSSLTGETWPLKSVAANSYKNGDNETALSFYLAVTSIDKRDFYSPAWASYFFSSRRQCERAGKWLEEAEARYMNYGPSDNNNKKYAKPLKISKEEYQLNCGDSPPYEKPPWHDSADRE